MRRRALAAAVSALGTISLLAAFSPASAAPPQLAARQLPMQKITWHKCFKKPPPKKPAFYALECAFVRAPLDWRKPNGKKIVLSISRLKARNGDPKGVVFTNPGGPGVVGWTLPLAFLAADRGKLLDNMDIIGIDVRGTGYSTQARCKNARGADALDPRVKKNASSLLAAAQRIAKACQTGGGKLPSQYVTTAQTVYDLEWLRLNLRDSKNNKIDKVHWIGYSGGTWLGAHYARRWPKSTGRFVLDSNVDFTASWQTVFNLQPKGFQRRFAQDFAGWAAKYNGEYRLGASPKAVVTRYNKIRAFIAKKGRIKVHLGQGRYAWLYASYLDNSTSQQLYSKYDFQNIASDMRYLSALIARMNNARAAAPTGHFTAVKPQAGETPTFLNITCNDTAFRGSASKLPGFAAKLGKKYPLVGYSKISEPCAFWKRAKAPQLKRPVANGPAVLMIQAYHDPATPYEGGLRAHRRYKNSKLVTVRNEGDHSIYAGGNQCVDEIVENYLVDGNMPGGDMTCQGVPIPGPQDGDKRTADRPANPLRSILEYEQLR